MQNNTPSGQREVLREQVKHLLPSAAEMAAKATAAKAAAAKAAAAKAVAAKAVAAKATMTTAAEAKAATQRLLQSCSQSHPNQSRKHTSSCR